MALSDNQPPFFDVNDPQNRRPPLAGDELLPPVEPPSVGFLFQLFIVPAVIVLIVVGVWGLFSWTVHSSNQKPADLVKTLQRPSASRYQTAMELANMLRDERYADFKKDSASVKELAQLLNNELDRGNSAGAMEDDAIDFRYFLCRVLGEFHVTDGLPALARAATTNRDEREEIVRRSGLQGMAVLAQTQHEHGTTETLDDPLWMETLTETSRDPSNLVRSETAYALGRLRTPEAVELLGVLVDDPFADARYNAAVALADVGDQRAMLALVEMLDASDMSLIAAEKDPGAKTMKRAVLLKNAQEAVRKLVEAGAEVDVAPIREQLERIVNASPEELTKWHVHSRMVSEAKRTLEWLEQGSPQREQG
jgi:hypothetical protein